MKYSILVPVHNKLEYIKKCFSSLLNQTYPNYEIIIIDDFSNEKTKEYLSTLESNKRVKLFRNEKNEGIGRTRNKLLSKASGDYIIFIDSDDYVEEDLLEKIEEIRKKTDVEIIRYNNVTEAMTPSQKEVESHKNPYRFSVPPTAKTITGEEALLSWCLGTNKINTMPWTYCIKKELYDGVFYPETPYLEDFPITPYLLAKAQRVFAMDYIGYHYRQYDSSLTKFSETDQILYAEEKLRVFREIIELTKQYLNRTNLSLEAKKIFFEDIEKRYELRKEKVEKMSSIKNVNSK